MAGKRIDYKTAMRSAIDARHQPSNVLAPGKPDSARHVSGAGIEHPQNKVAPGTAGTGSRSGAKGGPSEHPQNLVAPAEGSPAEESLETPAQEQAEQRAGVGDSNVAGPRAIGPASETIPHAGTGGDGKPGAKGGSQHGHPQNAVAVASAGKGGNGRGGAGGGAQALGGQPQNRVLLVKKSRTSKTRPRGGTA